ncbi:[acyl-carrier-protein] S-malonyltransferase [Streptacidiphilus sp. MAP12-16]|uniref:DUF7158 domain-containing protein n=1 Tax=Streptacidiphilus sp. MAP12-16 TaxID=3156300 RepID=UPI0035178B68
MNDTAAVTTRTQQLAEYIGWIDSEPVPRALLDARLAALRGGPLAAALPVPGSREGRQLVRWTAHALLTEQLCAQEAARRGLDTSTPVELDALGAVQLGSITAMAWRSHPAVSAVFRADFGGADCGTERLAGQRGSEPTAAPRWHLSLASGPTPAAARGAPLASIGWSTLQDLPPELAAAARSAAVGHPVGPLRSRDTWHRLRVDALGPAAAPVPAPTLAPSGPDLRAFARWLDLRRAQSVRVAPGFEHPGDPTQPDHTHRH